MQWRGVGNPPLPAAPSRSCHLFQTLKIVTLKDFSLFVAYVASLTKGYAVRFFNKLALVKNKIARDQAC